MVKCFLTQIAVLLSWWCAAAAESNNGMALTGCQDECGGVKIPFPFGIGQDCHFVSSYNFYSEDAYRVICDNTTANPIPRLPIFGNKEVLDINIQDHTIRVSSGVAFDCNTTKDEHSNISYNLGHGSSVPIIVSSSRNAFVSVGCGSKASLQQVVNGEVVPTSQCSTSCDGSSQLRNGTCQSYNGCCQESIMTTLSNPSIHVEAYSKDRDPEQISMCSYSFVVELGSYNFSAPNLTATPADCYDFRVPVVYDWFLLSDPYDCSAFSISDIGPVRHMQNGDDADFLTCNCFQGYTGNPYLPYGCQDTNECVEEWLNNCERQEYCVNNEGGYECHCPDGQLGKGTVTSPCMPVVAHGSQKTIIFVITNKRRPSGRYNAIILPT